MTSSGMQWTKAEPGHVSPQIDTTTANVARMYDYWLGGKDNFEADRVAAEKGLTQMPGQRRAELENRRTRVAYADYDPVVVAHGNALLATPDQSVVVEADIRRPGELLANPVI